MVGLVNVKSDDVGNYVANLSPEFAPYKDFFVRFDVNGLMMSKWENEDDVIGALMEIGIENMAHLETISSQLIYFQATVNAFKRFDEAVSDESNRPVNSSNMKLGLSLAAIDDFILSCGGSKALQGLTTASVYRQYVVPKLSSGHSFCQNVAAKQVGSACIYVSHSWNSIFLDTINALRHYFSTQHVYFWMDTFCSASLPSYPLMDKIVSEIANQVLVVAPWRNPKVLISPRYIIASFTAMIVSCP